MTIKRIKRVIKYIELPKQKVNIDHVAEGKHTCEHFCSTDR